MAEVESAGRLPLPVELHAATRTEHAALNRTIITRLPLCLPQATSTTILYAQGMIVFDHIYHGFEEAWDKLIQDDAASQRHRDILNTLNIPQLRRSQRLHNDLTHIANTYDPIVKIQLSHLQNATMDFREEIVQSILGKPHLLLAYTWAMYLALFNGGRFIVKQLLGAGTYFWGDDSRMATTKQSLSFWFFSDDETYDGEDLKITFKDRFIEVAVYLTDIEREEVVAECKKLFKMCAQMVESLDQHTQQYPQEHSTPATLKTNIPMDSRGNSDLFGYLTSFAPAPVVGMWRTISNRLPLSRSALLVPLRQEIEQQQG